MCCNFLGNHHSNRFQKQFHFYPSNFRRRKFRRSSVWPAKPRFGTTPIERRVVNPSPTIFSMAKCFHKHGDLVNPLRIIPLIFMAFLWLYKWVTTGSSTGMILQGMVKDVKLWNLPIVMACFTLTSFFLVIFSWTLCNGMDIALGG